MELHLARLREMHPLLALSTVADYAHRAAVGLGRHKHISGVSLGIDLDSRVQRGTLHWDAASEDDAHQLDFHRVTEDTAEAVALALVHIAKGWVVRRRLQRGEAADWLLVDPDHNLVALEVSGTDTVDTARRRLAEKVDQVGRCKIAGTKAACVVEIGPPRSRLRTA